jgi:hypothetical protein
MQRYTVAVLVADSSVNPLTLAIPFDPNAFVSAFVHELYSRSRKNGIRVNPKTHTLTLRLASENGEFRSTPFTRPTADFAQALSSTQEMSWATWWLNLSTSSYTLYSRRAPQSRPQPLHKAVIMSLSGS